MDDPLDFYVGRGPLHPLSRQRKRLLFSYLRNRLIISRSLSHSALLCQLSLCHHSRLHRRSNLKAKLCPHRLLFLLYPHLSLYDDHGIDLGHEGEFYCKMDSFIFARNMHCHLLCDHCSDCPYADQSKIARHWLWNHVNASKFGPWYLPISRRCTKIDTRRISSLSRISPPNIFLFSYQLPLCGNVHHSQGNRPDQWQQVGRQRLQEAVLEEDLEVGPGRERMIFASLYIQVAINI